MEEKKINLVVTIQTERQKDGSVVFHVHLGVLDGLNEHGELVIKIAKKYHTEPCQNQEEAITAMTWFSSNGFMPEKTAIKFAVEAFPSPAMLH
ncbi:MAG: hypothetical protein GW939_03640 [Candidatus Magasanikbacteria bacterium]|uniref:Uncharacterized protein n=1 Tax=Candidatus Magasanikbacteria bacterium CG10_big_fil_rev_8_21_14_0_10_38_6 TaxID=1974647 RepID=A0A2M6P0T2_9BACT|nr:hypothetical protein [Candidatus Magasanikbacteria bacterium]PIR77342.1 MAG: hypothetical protein COU30_03040 [Candidatus Magasanikbacteria bacterium CG10_big_fil_rev_8_21_14_0_10_38_6]